MFVIFFIKQQILIIFNIISINKRKASFFIVKIVYYNIQFLIFLTISNIFGFSLNNFLTGLSFVSFILSIIFKNIISSIISGIIIIINDHISIGDFIIYKKIKGIVIKINLRYLILRDEDNITKHIITNEILLSNYFSIKNKIKKYSP